MKRDYAFVVSDFPCFLLGIMSLKFGWACCEKYRMLFWLCSYHFKQEFSDPRDADDARYHLDGKEFDGSRIVVEFAVPLYMASLSTTITFILPVSSFAISSPMAIYATIKATSRAWRRTPAHIFSRTTRYLITLEINTNFYLINDYQQTSWMGGYITSYDFQKQLWTTIKISEIQQNNSGHSELITDYANFKANKYFT